MAQISWLRKSWASRLAIGLLSVALFVFVQVGSAQDPPADAPPKQQQPPPPSKPKQNKDSATQSAPDQPKWDPMRADKDIEVGKFYLRKGDLDAAIDRFQDAIEAKPGYAI